MYNVRKNVFETNSSSCHSLTIGDALPENFQVPKKMSVCNIEQGRDFEWTYPAEKYTALILMAESRDRLDKVIDMLYNIGVEENILSKALPHHSSRGTGLGYHWGLYEIDSYEADDYLDEILESEDSLKRYLFSPDTDFSGVDDNNFDY